MFINTGYPVLLLIGIQADGPGVEDGVENEERQENEESDQGRDSSE